MTFGPAGRHRSSWVSSTFAFVHQATATVACRSTAILGRPTNSGEVNCNISMIAGLSAAHKGRIKKPVPGDLPSNDKSARNTRGGREGEERTFAVCLTQLDIEQNAGAAEGPAVPRTATDAGPMFRCVLYIARQANPDRARRGAAKPAFIWKMRGGEKG